MACQQKERKKNEPIRNHAISFVFVTCHRSDGVFCIGDYPGNQVLARIGEAAHSGGSNRAIISAMSSIIHGTDGLAETTD